MLFHVLIVLNMLLQRVEVFVMLITEVSIISFTVEVCIILAVLDSTFFLQVLVDLLIDYYFGLYFV